MRLVKVIKDVTFMGKNLKGQTFEEIDQLGVGLIVRSYDAEKEKGYGSTFLLERHEIEYIDN